MSWDLIAELRQLSHDLVTASPQASAIKGKHPAILDAAAKRLADIEPLLPRWVLVAERLPPLGRQVAVLHNLLNGMLVLHIGAYHGEGYWADRYGLSLDPVYYCELPTPPESP